MKPGQPPRLNHVAISVDPALLYTGAFGEFVYLLPADPPPVAGRLDHFGFQVATLDELHEIVGRAKQIQADDTRVQVIEPSARTTHGPEADYVLTSAYLGFVLPLMIERHERTSAGS